MVASVRGRELVIVIISCSPPPKISTFAFYGGRGGEVGSISEAQRLLVLLIWQIFLRSGTVYQIRVYQEVYQRCISGLVCVYVLV